LIAVDLVETNQQNFAGNNEKRECTSIKEMDCWRMFGKKKEGSEIENSTL